ncbi:hypothetical protein [Pseudomonas sp. HLS-6 TE3448]
MDKQLGRLHTTACFNSASTFNEPTLRTKAYANAALTEIVKLQLEQPEILSTLLKGGNQGTKLLNTAPYQVRKSLDWRHLRTVIALALQ